MQVGLITSLLQYVIISRCIVKLQSLPLKYVVSH